MQGERPGLCPVTLALFLCVLLVLISRRESGMRDMKAFKNGKADVLSSNLVKALSLAEKIKIQSRYLHNQKNKSPASCPQTLLVTSGDH